MRVVLYLLFFLVQCGTGLEPILDQGPITTPKPPTISPFGNLTLPILSTVAPGLPTLPSLNLSGLPTIPSLINFTLPTFMTMAPLNLSNLPTLAPFNLSNLPTMAPFNLVNFTLPTLGTMAPLNLSGLPTFPGLMNFTMPTLGTMPPLNLSGLPTLPSLANFTMPTFMTLAPLNLSNLPSMAPFNLSGLPTLPTFGTIPPLNLSNLPTIPSLNLSNLPTLPPLPTIALGNFTFGTLPTLLPFTLPTGGVTNGTGATVTPVLLGAVTNQILGNMTMMPTTGLGMIGNMTMTPTVPANMTMLPGMTTIRPAIGNITMLPGMTPTVPAIIGNMTLLPGMTSSNMTMLPGLTTMHPMTGNMTMIPGMTPTVPANMTLLPGLTTMRPVIGNITMIPGMTTSHAANASLTTKASTTPCGTSSCTPDQVCASPFNSSQICTRRLPDRRYCIDNPCSPGMKCFDNVTSNAYTCYTKLDGGAGECLGIQCSPGDICYQVIGQQAKCIQLHQAPRCIGLNEEFSACKSGCEATCSIPNPPCMNSTTCTSGCSCIRGYVRVDGVCQLMSACPSVTTGNVTCSGTEIYTACKPACEKTCSGVLSTTCLAPATCVPGCTCQNAYKRDSHGQCVHTRQCYSSTKCGPNESWSRCHNCETICGQTANPSCKTCWSGCGCNPGYSRSPNGTCVQQCSV